MAYSTFQADESYRGAGSGSEYLIQIINEDNPSESFTGFSGLSHTDSFEIVPIEEAGNDGVDEFADGRHNLSLQMNGFWRAAYNDSFFLTRQNFIGKRWTVFRKKNRGAYAGTVVDVFTGTKLESYSSQQGARGAITFSMSGQASRRYNGAEWVAEAGE